MKDVVFIEDVKTVPIGKVLKVRRNISSTGFNKSLQFPHENISLKQYMFSESV